MIKLSASSIKDYLACPAMFYYRLNYPELSIQTTRMALGSVVHFIVEKYWNNSEKGLEELQKILKEQSELDSKKAIKCLENFYKRFVPAFTKDSYEKTEKYFSIPYKNYTMVGKFDRINTNENIVWDWKTSTELVKDISNDIQFIIYYESYKEIYKKEPSVFYASLMNGSLVRFKPNKFIIDNLYNEVIPGILEGIKNNVYYRKGVFEKFRCENCSYNKICLEDAK
jgi:CRISPR/Cas system-associated exonuclease Cas4 (RecB family)